MIPNPNHRKYPRRAAYIIAEYTVREGTYRDVIKGIGAGGLFVWTSRKIADGQSIRLAFPLIHFSSVIRVSGRVTRKTPDGFAVAFDEPIDDLICEEDGQFPPIVHEGDR